MWRAHVSVRESIMIALCPKYELCLLFHFLCLFNKCARVNSHVRHAHAFLSINSIDYMVLVDRNKNKTNRTLSEKINTEAYKQTHIHTQRANECERVECAVQQ